ncbi:MAG: sulfur carrier protein ThiS [Oscillospiraceae bacterium]|nr:sulfur carrier protein ThiS [Oscillospiraceae bacterium]
MKINGSNTPRAEGKTILDYLESSGYVPLRVAVEVNNTIISRDDFDKYIISDNDEIEIVAFMGGG